MKLRSYMHASRHNNIFNQHMNTKHDTIVAHYRKATYVLYSLILIPHSVYRAVRDLPRPQQQLLVSLDYAAGVQCHVIIYIDGKKGHRPLELNTKLNNVMILWVKNIIVSTVIVNHRHLPFSKFQSTSLLQLHS